MMLDCDKTPRNDDAERTLSPSHIGSDVVQLPLPFTVLRASRHFVLDGRAIPGYPIVVDSRGRVLLPVADYLHERAVNANSATGCLVGEAYVLAEWFAYLRRRHIIWTRASDDALRDWVREQEARRIGRRRFDRIGKARIQVKLGIVFRFYYTAQAHLGLIEAVIEDPERGLTGPQYPISVRVVVRKGKDGEKRLIFRPRIHYSTVPKCRRGRPTPSPEQAEKVLDQLLDRPSDHAAVTHWFCGNWMRQAGLRAGGASSLTTTALAQSLFEEGIAKFGGSGRKRPCDLPALADDLTARGQILRALYAKKDAHRRNMFVEVTEKASVTRAVPVPIDFFIQNLEYIWDQRAAFVRSRQARDPNYVAGDAMWLSTKTGDALAPKSIGNAMGMAFKLSDVAGSGHRFRALFAQEVVRDAYLRARAAHGRAWDARAVLLLAAEALGHKDPETLRPYLHDILREDQLVEGEPVLIIDRKKAAKVRALVDALNEGDLEAERQIDFALVQLGRTPIPENETIEDVRERVRRRRASA